MPGKKQKPTKPARRRFTKEFKEEAVQMLLDGHTASSISDRLGLSGANVLYRWKAEQLQQSGPVASSLEARVRELELELRRVERERDVLPLDRSTPRQGVITFGIEIRTGRLDDGVKLNAAAQNRRSG
ncbi:Transposase [Pirellulimonas nuda]|uniref:Transposase n=1 Tax=Pirellulimonas nuda TaxID=2528009 RepID=A0A518DDE8_9BACT|nr:transposase [Pirellulimonas nuda]QDU89505.1 Transposase [Pirellulimonas nuda]